MFEKSKGNSAKDERVVPAPVQQFQRLAVTASASPETEKVISSISSGMTIVGKIACEGTVKIFGSIQGELQATTIVISDGAQVEGEIVAEDLTIGGRVKGTMHANRVKLTGSAIVDGDIFHQSLVIDESARFEGSSRRKDDAVNTLSSGQTKIASLDDNRKLNGPPDNEQHVSGLE